MKTAQIYRKNAYEKLKGNWKPVLLVTLIAFGIDLMASVLQMGFEARETFVSYILSIALLTLLYPIMVGMEWAYLGFYRNGKISIEGIFEPFFSLGMYLKVLRTGILSVVYTFLWALLLIVPGLIKSISYSQCFLILKDEPELTARQAITKSKLMMKGYKWRCTCLLLSFTGWFLLSILTLGIGLLWLIPYASVAFSEFYEEVKMNYESKQEVVA